MTGVVVLFPRGARTDQKVEKEEQTILMTVSTSVWINYNFVCNVTKLTHTVQHCCCFRNLALRKQHAHALLDDQFGLSFMPYYVIQCNMCKDYDIQNLLGKTLKNWTWPKMN